VLDILTDVDYLFCVPEIEAAEACKWLRAAGFPQYAQMYEGKYYNQHWPRPNRNDMAAVVSIVRIAIRAINSNALKPDYTASHSS
jgi:hypothetical protein